MQEVQKEKSSSSLKSSSLSICEQDDEMDEGKESDKDVIDLKDDDDNKSTERNKTTIELADQPTDFKLKRSLLMKIHPPEKDDENQEGPI